MFPIVRLPDGPYIRGIAYSGAPVVHRTGLESDNFDMTGCGLSPAPHWKPSFTPPQKGEEKCHRCFDEVELPHRDHSPQPHWIRR